MYIDGCTIRHNEVGNKLVVHTVFWRDVTVCSLVQRCQCFREVCYICLTTSLMYQEWKNHWSQYQAHTSDFGWHHRYV
jgi:hypothetical protein